MFKEQSNKLIISDSRCKIILKSSLGSISKLGQIFSWLSLDVVLGAMVCNIMVFKLMNINPVPWIQNIILGFTVWLIYLLDHLWDVRSYLEKPKIERRLFFYNNFKALSSLAVLLLIGIFVCSILFLPLITIYFGIITAIFVCFYLILVHFGNYMISRNWFHKEVLVGILYGIGIWGSAAVLSTKIELEHYLLAVNFILVAFLNLIIFSMYEFEEDIQREQYSIVQFMGKIIARKAILLIIILIVLIGGLIMLISQQRPVQNWVFLEWTMASILFCLALFPNYFKNNNTYRFLGDGVFILPAILWLFNSF